jgi:phosphatidylglycerophosphate synthase
MHRIKLAVIYLDLSEDGSELLLQRPVAGVKLFDRLILTLNRSGLDKIIVISRGLEFEEKVKIESRFIKDDRFNGKLTWYDQENFLKEENVLEKIRSVAGPHGFLFVRNNIVTTSHHVKDFIHNVMDSKALERKVVSSTPCNQNRNGGLFFVPTDRLNLINQYIQMQVTEEPVETTQPEENRNFCVSVHNISDVRAAEKSLLKQQKLNYTQLMDVCFNSLFSIRISSWLVKTPFTPNQLTLSGLVLGVLTGWFFAQGDYFNGVLGGLVLVFSGIWDCCDGDVARLKFMESDYGEYLDTMCDNIINILTFIGIAIGVAKQSGLLASLIPFVLLLIGGTLIFILIYFPKGSGKGYSFKGTRMYDVVLLLASRNFIYVILLFAILGRLDYFLWLAGFGSNIFAMVLFLAKFRIISMVKTRNREGT